MKQDAYYILAINPGSTSTKLAVYADKELVDETKIEYDAQAFANLDDIMDQEDLRLKDIDAYLQDLPIPLDRFSGIVGRGGVLPPVKSGAYIVNDLMIDRLRNRSIGPHASSLGAVLAQEIAGRVGLNAHIYDSICVDEMPDVARVTGIDKIERWSRCHVLNMRAVSMKIAEKMGRSYHDLRLVVVHLGGGITLSVHDKGRIVDMVLDSEGPLSPERAGRIPGTQLLNYLHDHKLAFPECLREIRGNAGMVSLLGSNSALEVEQRAKNGDQKAALVLEALAYQTAKAIGELATVVYGNLDAIILTGALVKSKAIAEDIAKRVSFLAPVEIYPGENEMEALAYGMLRVLRGEESAHIYDMETDSQDKDKVIY